MDDWQETAFNNRRLPHGRSGRGGGGRKGGAFDVRKTYGVYEIRGSAIDRLTPDGRAVVEIHGLTDGGDGLVGSIEIGTAFKGMLLLAGSRRTLERIVRDTERAERGEEEEEEEEERERRGSQSSGRGVNGSGLDGGEGGEDDDGEEDGDDEDDEDDDGDVGRASTFEKNTFRSPKFWVQWRAEVRVGSGKNVTETGETDRGYLVFAGNDCKNFQGTLNCRTLGWKNVAITGRRLTPKASDCLTNWTDVELTRK